MHGKVRQRKGKEEKNAMRQTARNKENKTNFKGKFK